MIDGKLLIEVREAHFVNKGAELMLYAIMDQIRKRMPNAAMAMAPTHEVAPYNKRAVLGLYQKAHYWRNGHQFGTMAGMIPERVRRMYGIVVDSEVDVVLDAAGFKYTDKWGMNVCDELVDSCERWRRNGSTIILLPQAFGPLESKRNRSAMSRVLEIADLIFARDKVSYKYLKDLKSKKNNIRVAPDFTNLLEGVLPTWFDSGSCQFCLIPNYRMIDKTSSLQSRAYLPFMINAAKIALDKGLRPYILVHEGEKDLSIGKEIQNAVSSTIPIIRESSPLCIKGIIGASKGMVGSRFHGLVSALAQGVPALATGWSHKYEMLYNDYGFNDGVVDVSMSKDDLEKKIEIISNTNSRKKIVDMLLMHSENLKRSSERMWGEVFERISHDTGYKLGNQ